LEGSRKELVKSLPRLDQKIFLKGEAFFAAQHDSRPSPRHPGLHKKSFLPGLGGDKT
jgi:hypothetical protein